MPILLIILRCILVACNRIAESIFKLFNNNRRKLKIDFSIILNHVECSNGNSINNFEIHILRKLYKQNCSNNSKNVKKFLFTTESTVISKIKVYHGGFSIKKNFSIFSETIKFLQFSKIKVSSLSHKQKKKKKKKWTLNFQSREVSRFKVKATGSSNFYKITKVRNINVSFNRYRFSYAVLFVSLVPSNTTNVMLNNK